MSDIKISVIVPVYNAEMYIVKALNSIISQKYVDEIIIVNDCSTDKSILFAKEIKKTSNVNIKIIEHGFKTNIGAGESRNIGIKEAKNQWLAFLDVDDYYYPDRFDNAINVIDLNKDADGVYEAVENVFSNEKARVKFLKTRPKRYERIDLKKIQTFFTLDKEVKPKNLFEELMSGNIGFFHFNGVLIKKSLFQRVGFLNKELKLTQDTDVFFKMAMIGNLYPGKLFEPVSARLVHNNNRIYNNGDKLKYYALLKYYGFKKWSKEKNINTYTQNIIEQKNIKLCAKLLNVNIYKYYKIKHFALKSLYPIIIPFFLKIKKYKLKIN